MANARDAPYVSYAAIKKPDEFATSVYSSFPTRGDFGTSPVVKLMTSDVIAFASVGAGVPFPKKAYLYSSCWE